MRRRAALAPVVAVLTMGGVAVPAGAAPPTREPISSAGSYVIDDLCPFPIDATTQNTGEQRTSYDRDGDVVQVASHITATDTFSANGTTLTGLPYRYNIRTVIDDGEVQHVYVSGILIRVALPDGKVFKTAGRLDFLAHLDDDFVAVPDKGGAIDLAPFCAALS